MAAAIGDGCLNADQGRNCCTCALGWVPAGRSWCRAARAMHGGPREPSVPCSIHLGVHQVMGKRRHCATQSPPTLCCARAQPASFTHSTSGAPSAQCIMQQQQRQRYHMPLPCGREAELHTATAHRHKC